MRKFYLLAAGAMLLASNAFAEVEKFPTSKQLFCIDATTVGAAASTEATSPSIASVGGAVLICEGNGSPIIVVDGLTGEKLSTIDLGEGIVASAITNDEAGNVLIVTHAGAGETVNIYKVVSTDATPELFYSFTNDDDCPTGVDIKVSGNVNEKAVITIPVEGVPNVTSTSDFFVVTVNGEEKAVEHKDISALGISWGDGHNCAGVVTYADGDNAGTFVSYYGGSLSYVTAAGEVTSVANDPTGWGMNCNNMDIKKFNGHNYLAIFIESFFTYFTPTFCLCDVTDMSNFKVMENLSEGVSASPMYLDCTIYTEDPTSFTEDGGNATGDVVICPDEENGNLYVYAIGHQSEVLVGYQFSASAEGGDESGVADVVVDENAPVEYFNLQGVRVANPENGIFVRRQGNQVSKVVVK